MNNRYYIFGSASSLDLDVLVFIDHLPSLEESKKMCNVFNESLKSISSKKINSNLATIKSNVLTSVFKGTLDEVNNSVIDTYHLHKQVHPLIITQRIKRDKDAKVLRSVRSILSFLSRTQYREQVKQSLQNDLSNKLDALDNIDLSLPLELTKYPIVDVYKTISFQIGQCSALLDDIELFTKEDIANRYPMLTDFIFRKTDADIKKLNQAKTEFVKKVNDYKPKMVKLKEDKWSN